MLMLCGSACASSSTRCDSLWRLAICQAQTTAYWEPEGNSKLAAVAPCASGRRRPILGHSSSWSAGTGQWCEHQQRSAPLPNAHSRTPDSTHNCGTCQDRRHLSRDHFTCGAPPGLRGTWETQTVKTLAASVLAALLVAVMVMLCMAAEMQARVAIERFEKKYRRSWRSGRA